MKTIEELRADLELLHVDSMREGTAKSNVEAALDELEALRAQVAAEREACAQLAEKVAVSWSILRSTKATYSAEALHELAAGIRARGDK